MAITPPEDRIWWNAPVALPEKIWITIAFLWGVVMFSMMIYWHVAGSQNLSSEAYRIDPATFQERAMSVAQQHWVRDEGGIPVVRPPPGSDIYLIARLWSWWPIYELEDGATYRMHVSSMDWQHGFSLQPVNINLQVHPGYDMVLNLTPDGVGEYGIVCNEFCGIGHHLMVGKLYVVD